MAASEKNPLSAETWAQAALDAMAMGGLEAVAVEPLARQLGVTKGSFYWHFTNRDALIRAALARWEKQETDELLARAENESAPIERMHTLFRSAANTDSRSERLLLVLSASDHAAARDCVQRITGRWRDYIHDCYRALGLNDPEAGYWATFAFSTFMGTVRMRRDSPDALPSGGQFNDYLRFLIRSLIPKAAREALKKESHPSVVPMRKTGTK